VRWQTGHKEAVDVSIPLLPSPSHSPSASATSAHTTTQRWFTVELYHARRAALGTPHSAQVVLTATPTPQPSASECSPPPASSSDGVAVAVGQVMWSRANKRKRWIEDDESDGEQESKVGGDDSSSTASQPPAPTPAPAPAPAVIPTSNSSTALTIYPSFNPPSQPSTASPVLTPRRTPIAIIDSPPTTATPTPSADSPRTNQSALTGMHRHTFTLSPLFVTFVCLCSSSFI
jgi:hypothetical protein